MGVKQQEDLSEKHYFYTRDYSSMFIYRATTPKNPDFPHTAGAKPHQLNTSSSKTLFKASTPKHRSPDRHN